MHISKILRTFASSSVFLLRLTNANIQAWSLVRAAMPIFVSYRFLKSLKTCASIAHHVVGNAIEEESLILMDEIVFVDIHKSRIFDLWCKDTAECTIGKRQKK